MEKVLDELTTSDSYTIYWLRDTGLGSDKSIMPDDLFLYDHNVLQYIEDNNIIVVENYTELEIENENLPEDKRITYSVLGVLQDGETDEIYKGFKEDEAEEEMDTAEWGMNDGDNEYSTIIYLENGVVMETRDREEDED